MCNTCKKPNCNCGSSNHSHKRVLATIADIRATIAILNAKINEALQEINYPTLQKATDRGNVTDNYITFKKIISELNSEDLSKIYNSLTILQEDEVAKILFNTYVDKLEPTAIELSKEGFSFKVEDILSLAVTKNQASFSSKVSGLDAVNENDFVTLKQSTDKFVGKVTGKSLVDDNQITKLLGLNTQSEIDARIGQAIAGEKGSIGPTDSAPTEDGIYRAKEEGVYPNLGGLVVPTGKSVWFSKIGSVWTIYSEIDAATATGVIEEGNTNATSGDTVFKHAKPLYDLTIPPQNLSDNVFELGGWRTDNGQPQETNNVKRLAETIVITPELVGQHWISGRGILPAAYSFVIVRTTVSNPPILSIPGTASDDDLAPITFTITPEMVGMILRFSPGMTASEPSVGYENTFMWNMGAEPLPFTPKKLLIDGSKVKDVALEIYNNQKVVRAKQIPKRIYTNISGEEGGDSSGFFRYDTGVLEASVNRKYILFPVDFSNKYVLSSVIDGASLVADAVYFDSNMNYLGFNKRVETGTITLDREELIFPDTEEFEGVGFIGTGNFNNRDYPVLESYVEVGAVWDNSLFESELEVVLPKNLFDSSSLNIGWMNTEGVIGNSDTYRHTNPIDISNLSNNIFCSTDIDISEWNKGYRFVTAFDSNMNILVNQGEDSGGTQLNQLYSHDGTVKYIVVTIYTAAINRFQIEDGNSRTSYEPYSPAYISKIKGYELLSSISNNSPLINKTIFKIGDSIIKTASGNIGFTEQIAAKYNMNIIDYSVGGATITYNGNGTNDIVRQVEQAVSTNLPTDYILLNGQTNDILATRDIPLGDISTGYDATLDRETFTGALEWICKSLKTNWPQAKIVYVKVHHMDTRPYDRQEIFGDRVLDVMKKWAIPVADIYKNGQMNSYIPIHRQLFTNNQDGTHPNTLGYTKFYVPIIESLLNSI